MATQDASIKQAQLPSQDDLTKRREHCSADPRLLEAIGRAVKQQVRIVRADDEYGLYTVSEVRPETAAGVVRMGRGGRERLGTPLEFDGVVDAQVTRSDLADDKAEDLDELVERLGDDRQPRGLIAIAPHGGDIEPHTDEQAERVATQLGSRSASSWLCRGWKRDGGAFDRWHITSTDINPACFPLLGSVMTRGFTYAVAFHGFDDDEILIGGTAPPALKEEIRCAIDRATTRARIVVRIAGPDDDFGGDDPDNIVNRLTAGGENGIQIEQSLPARTEPGLAIAIADAVADVYALRLQSAPVPWFEPVRRLFHRVRNALLRRGPASPA